MTTLGIVLIIYGVFCIFIGLLKPPMIWNMGKLRAMSKMMGEKGLRIFILIWGTAALIGGYLLYK